MLYPLLQSYDSVALRADVELGSTDLLLVKLIVDARMALSNSEARRLIVQGGVKVDGVKVDGVKVADPKAALCAGEYLVQVGKLRAASVSLG